MLLKIRTRAMDCPFKFSSTIIRTAFLWHFWWFTSVTLCPLTPAKTIVFYNGKLVVTFRRGSKNTESAFHLSLLYLTPRILAPAEPVTLRSEVHSLLIADPKIKLIISGFFGRMFTSEHYQSKSKSYSAGSMNREFARAMATRSPGSLGTSWEKYYLLRDPLVYFQKIVAHGC